MTDSKPTQRKVLIVERGTFMAEDTKRLYDLGFHVVWAYDVNGIKSVGDVPLRDYFAAAALQGYRSSYHKWYQTVGAKGEFTDPATMARWSYADADAMLAERDK